MFKFITEAAAPNFNAIKDVTLVENKELGTKDMYITGIFIQCLVKNRNGRVYDKMVMEQAVAKYVQERMADPNGKLRSYGELGHPEGVEINLHRVSHMITELTWQDNDVYGKAKLLDTEYGRIASSIIKQGGQLGVSSRGLGELSRGPVGENLVTQFELIAEDIVADPSAPEGYVEGILEGKEYILQGGVYTPINTRKISRAYEGLENMMESLPKKDVDTYILNAVKKFFKEI
jgi:hypothetical protein